MTALYSVNLHIMGKSNVPLLSETTLATDGRARRRGADRHDVDLTSSAGR